ncbi:MAG TPA: efflux RND transporter periplasmic adaptor subunit [Candidatus Acidoferrales bacterium]|nr:efflux RND transporter periplasmic adaptor subunit [Candidatus Acidoferrales bacterium]
MTIKRGLGLGLASSVVALLGVGFWRLGDGAKESPYIAVAVQRGDITQVVSATGTLQAVITVQVGTQVSGTIDKLYADFNSRVKAGEPVARIKQDKFKAAVDQARANLLAAQSNQAKAKVAVEDTKRTLARHRELMKRQLIAQSELDAAQTAYDAAVAQVEVNTAQVEQARAALNQATVDLENTIIRSPVDGIVISRNVDVGQTVAASLQSPVLFTIANDLSKMEVHTSVDEADVGKIWEGQDVSFTVDAFPTRRFRGKVFQVRNAPTTVQNVVTYNAVVRIDNKELLLKPGMTANVEFLVSRKENVLRLPNMALRFKPPEHKQDAQEILRQANRAAGASRRRAGGGRSRSGEGRDGRWVRVYLLKELRAEPVDIRVGITDGSYTEVVEGDVEEGSQVIIALSERGKAAVAQSGPVNPFQPPRRSWR